MGGLGVERTLTTILQALTTSPAFERSLKETLSAVRLGRPRVLRASCPAADLVLRSVETSLATRLPGAFVKVLPSSGATFPLSRALTLPSDVIAANRRSSEFWSDCIDAAFLEHVKKGAPGEYARRIPKGTRPPCAQPIPRAHLLLRNGRASRAMSKR